MQRREGEGNLISSGLSESCLSSEFQRAIQIRSLLLSHKWSCVTSVTQCNLNISLDRSAEKADRMMN